MVLLWLPLAAPIGLSPLLILTLCGPERVLVVSTEPPDDLSCLTTPGVGRPGDGAVARAVDQGHPEGRGVEGWAVLRAEGPGGTGVRADGAQRAGRLGTGAWGCVGMVDDHREERRYPPPPYPDQGSKVPRIREP